MSNELSIKSLKKAYSEGRKLTEALSGISLNVKAGSFVSIIGPSGSGKTTLLNCIAGFTKYSEGTIQFKKPKENIGFVFQDRLLFPWMTVQENIALGIKAGEERLEKKVSAILASVGLKGFESHYPNELSMGMQQRVNLARAIAPNPDFMLLDEPFASVDYLTRLKLQELVVRLWEKSRKTMIFVTHDIDEAIFISERIIILSKRPGRIIEEIEVNLPRPRNSKTLTSREFYEIKAKILQIMREEEDS